MANIFKQVEHRNVKSNVFNLSHHRKFSMAMGKLVPSMLIEAVPGDKFNIDSSALVRFAPLVSPVMHEVNVYTHFFFVPNRLLWDNWENFITGGEDGMDESVTPKLNYGLAEMTEGLLPDYMGLPVLADELDTQSIAISALPFAGYKLIYNEYYRDQNLIAKQGYKLQDGIQPWQHPDGGDFSTINTRAWEHDYFTSALPWTQKGVEATIPLGSEAPVLFDWQDSGGLGDQVINDTSGLPATGSTKQLIAEATAGKLLGDAGGTQAAVTIDNARNLKADLTEAAAASINELRRAFRLQEWLEKNARGGSRYTESIYSHFGVKSPDARLDRPEFIGGSKAPVTFSEVLNTTGANDDSGGGSDIEFLPQGNMAGHGISVSSSSRKSYYVQEHGYIFGIMSVLPKTAYQQGIPKHFKKFDKFDFYWPEFSNLGEQPIYNYEIYADQSDLDYTNAVFGYTPRYAEYKFMSNTVHGDFKKEPLNTWHMGRVFADQPNLNAAFVNSNPTQRIFADTDPDIQKLYVHLYNRVKAVRKMPIFGTPSI